LKKADEYKRQMNMNVNKWFVS